MRVLRGCTWILLALGLVSPDSVRGAQPPKEKKNKVIIYPAGDESIAQLQQQGITKADDYGSYWVVEATDQQANSLKRTRGNRVIQANYLNRIELMAVQIDTTGAEPAALTDLQQPETGGRRLRLIQFKGPVRSEWLEQVKVVGGIKV